MGSSSHPPVSSAGSFYCNLSNIAAETLDTFTCKGAEKQRARGNGLLMKFSDCKKALWNDQVVNNNKRK